MVATQWKRLIGLAAHKGFTSVFLLWIGLRCFVLHAQDAGRPAPATLAEAQIAAKNFGADAPWFLRNIPFLEIDDAEIQRIYYYRWKLFRAHIRQIGEPGVTVTEFLPNVPWARQPYTDLNDSASFHLMEGRWLRDPAVVDSLIDHLYAGGGNDRHFSEWIAYAAWSTTLVTGDPAPAVRHLDSMQYIFNAWDDHFDWKRKLYWIEPIGDATEYSIASIDASGAGFTSQPSRDDKENGFTKGFAFRPSINSYQFANAEAIAELAKTAGEPKVAEEYAERAASIRAAVLNQLWNPALQHFTDRYQRSTKYVQAGEFIRGRELVGYVPWTFDLPPKSSSVDYAQAWSHVLSSAELAGAYGLRTVEPTYPRYLTQYRYDKATGLPECQWNGPSWPFQTSQALMALANLLNDYQQTTITRGDYLRLLRQYTHQHELANGEPDLQEDYNPDTGAPIVGLPRSHHYNHSTYVDLILSGLIGIRPRSDDILEVNPLLAKENAAQKNAIRYFDLQDLVYHGHTIGVIYDRDGSRYGLGKGLSLFVDGRRAAGPSPLGRIEVKLGPSAKAVHATGPHSVDLAVNVGAPGFPRGSASTSASPESVAEAIDGRMWFFPEIVNGWSPAANDPASWYAVDFGGTRKIASLRLYFADQRPQLAAPAGYAVEIKVDGQWKKVGGQRRKPETPLAPGVNLVTFPAVDCKELRVVFTSPARPATFRLIELEAFGPQG